MKAWRAIYTFLKEEERGNFLLLALLLVGLFFVNHYMGRGGPAWPPSYNGQPHRVAPTNPTSYILLGQKIPINTASTEVLQALPRIGEKTAEKIITHRPYKKTEDLLKVPGLGKKKLEKIQPYLTISSD